ncbi:uncharacterized protein VTP21DRAFT_4942 [Calcarisporiella thermophila]|uniref:uncharacterized protein n=1 Tax=Calcarisporiella thermophila TaxID=911321 RepID=UPI003743267E
MFGSGGGFGSSGFGQQNQPQQQTMFGQPQQQQNTTGFGGFNQQPTAFGQNTASTPFGQTSTTPAFGTGTTGGFGSTPAFGQQQQQQRSSFGTGGGLFGSNTASTPASSAPSFGFGSSTSTTPAFGSASTGTGLFGQKPATTTTGFGSTTGTGLFGSTGSSTTTGFGSTTPGFGASNLVGGNGTASPAYEVTSDKDATSGQMNMFHSITAMPAYRNWSFEELRFQDYQQNRKSASTGFGSSFGATSAAPTSTGFGTASTPFGSTSSTGMFGQQQQQQTPAFGQTTTGGFGTAGGFGSTQSTGGIFGSQPSTGTSGGLFGSKTPSTPFGATTGTTTGGFGGTGFGTSTSGFGTQQQNTPFSFGQASTSQTPAFGQTGTTPGFGQAAQTSQPGSLFGATSTTPAFGAATSTATPSFGFGQQSTAQTSTTPAFNFGSSATQKPATSFTFGQSSTGTGGFGAAQNKPGGFGGFGTSAATTTPAFGAGTSTGGLFGTATTQASTTPGLFGSTTTPSLFGNTGTSTGGLFGGTTPAASNAVSTGGLFGAQTTTPSFGGFGAGTAGTQAGSTGSLFGQRPATGFGNSTTLGGSIQPTMQASIDKFPYGRHPLFDVEVPTSTGLPTETPKKKPTPLPPVKPTPRSSSKSKSRSFLTPSASTTAVTPAKTPQSLHLFDGVRDDVILSADAFQPRRSVKKLIIDRKQFEPALEPSVTSFTPVAQPVEKEKEKSTGRPRVTFDPNLEEQAAENFVERIVSNTPVKKLDFTAMQKSPVSTEKKSGISDGFASPNRLADGYWMEPSLIELRNMSHDQLSKVRNFTVGRRGYGRVRFQMPVDLTTVRSLANIAGGIVIFEPRSCTVYPDDNVKPKVGEELNVPATIELENVGPKDGQELITDPDHPRVVKLIRKLRKMPDTEFIDFEPKTGTWIFKVQHFSRYGLEDEEEEEQDTQQKTSTQRASNFNPQEPSGSSSQRMAVDAPQEEDEDAPPTESLLTALSEKKPAVRTGFGVPDLTESSDESETGDALPTTGDQEAPHTPLRFSGIARTRARLGVEPHQAQVMQASLFGTPTSTGEKSKLTPLTPHWIGSGVLPSYPAGRQDLSVTTQDESRLNAGKFQSKLTSGSFFERPSGGGGRDDQSDMNLDAPQILDDSTVGYEFPSSLQVLPPRKKPTRRSIHVGMDKSVLRNHLDNVVDAGLMMGRSFRVGWGTGGIIVRNLGSSNVSLDKLRIFVEEEDVQKKRHETSLKVQLELTEIVQDAKGIPKAYTLPNADFGAFVENMFINKDLFHTNELLIFKLGKALWDHIPSLVDDTFSRQVADHIRAIDRKSAFSRWLQEAVEPEVLRDLQTSVSQRDGASAIFTYLTGKQIAKACMAAIKNRDFRLSTLLAQAGGDVAFREDLMEQVEKWKELRFESEISKSYRKIYELLSGEVGMSKGVRDPSPHDCSDTIFIAEGLDWKRTLGLHLWYGIFEDSVLNKAVTRYETFFKQGEGVPPPLPWYLERPEEVQTGVTTLPREKEAIDVLFQLMKLYTDSTHSLNSTLCPNGITPSLMDHRISWHLYRLLAKVLRVRDFNDRAQLYVDEEAMEGEERDEEEEGWSSTADSVCASFALQLENLGLWEWAIFVLLHLNFAENRESAIKEILGRHLSISPIPDEHMSQKEDFLTSTLKIPETWLHEAKAVRAKYEHNYRLEAIHWLKAGQWSAGHKLIVTKLAPEAIINGDLTMLRDLLERVDSRMVWDWHVGGQLFLEYIEYIETIPLLLRRLTRGEITREKLYIFKPKLQRLLRDLGELRRDEFKGDVRRVVCIAEMASQISGMLQQIDSRLSDDEFLLVNVSLPQDQRLLRLQKLSSDYFSGLVEQSSH